MDKNYFKSNSIEIRVAEGGNSLIISGFIPTNQLSHSLFDKKKKVFFREKIKDGAFASAINEKTPLLLLNHSYKDELEVISFEWSEGAIGLRFEAEVLPDEALIKAIDNDSINGLSFGFLVVDKSGESWEMIRGEWIRTIHKFNSLIEISVLWGESNIPAYPQTTAFVDSSKKVIMEKEIHHLRQELNRMRLEDMTRQVKQLKKGIR